jgi:hypothetical protein
VRSESTRRDITGGVNLPWHGHDAITGKAAAPSQVRVPAPYANRHRYIARWPATTAADMKALIRPLSYVDPTTDSQLAKGRLPVDHHELTSAFGTAVQARK